MDLTIGSRDDLSIVESGYVFGRSWDQARQHRLLGEAYDQVTCARLASTGVSDGWRCLEAGAGGGSVAHWLAKQVAPSGSVTATDLDPGWVPPHPGLRVLRHDLALDPLPERAYDLIHVRLVLRHLPQRRAVLDKLAAALKPGGILQIDEFDQSHGPALLAPDQAALALYRDFVEAKERMFADAGVAGDWGRRVAAEMVDAGLTDVDPEPAIFPWQAGSPGVELLIFLTRRLRDGLVAAGMTDERLAGVRDLLRSPGFRATSGVFYTVQGRRP
ncbi:class I SAM-dependent methyltransferase [Amycolatopsis sp. cg5]|uniref:class I SAM-dependent methyltransferase n=1 Tax=Amycolatopsis sp. cg5 TaxID=3238802 RepID=UPI003526B4BB